MPRNQDPAPQPPPDTLRADGEALEAIIKALLPLRPEQRARVLRAAAVFSGVAIDSRDL